MPNETPGLDVISRGEARSPARRRRGASFYADPSAWLVIDAVEAALAEAGDRIRGNRAEIGVLSVSERGTLDTMRSVAAAVDRGRVSPLRFAGAGPGSMAGLACILFGFKGPSLVLSMPPEQGRRVAESLARGWLSCGGCRYVVVNEHETGIDGSQTVRTRIVHQDRS